LLLIDAHCHASPSWFEPVESLLFQMERCGIGKAVLTQILGQFDNSYQQDCLARYPGRFASIGAVDTTDEAAPHQVEQWANRGMAGLRLRPEARSPGTDPLAVWRAAARCGLAISCGGASAHLLSEDFRSVVGAFPTMPIVIEHLGGWTRPDCDRQDATWQGILGIARHPNILLKIPALGQLASRRPGQPLPAEGPVLDSAAGAILLQALDAFGADRLMWGSDFPVVSSREGYANALHWTRDIFAQLQPQEVAAIFGGTAARIFFPLSA